MPVNYFPPEILYPVAGVRLGVAEAGIRKKDRKDLTLIALEAGAAVAGVFTQNRFCAAPVQLCRQHLAAGRGVRALVINTGIANAGTGEAGRLAAQATCEAVGALLNIPAEAVLPFSTGVILEPLPVERLIAALPAASANLGADCWRDAAYAIMTTDTVAKAASRRVVLDGGKTLTVTGISKGAGMIRPDMATMLGFVATDAAIAQPLLETLVREAAELSFNCITVDGDTSTNDSFIIIASGKGELAFVTGEEPGWAETRAALIAVAVELAQAIVRDGEGATKFITVAVEGGRNVAECRQVAYAIAHSPLVKTAFFASDPNLGRILAAVGYAGIADLEVEGVKVWLEAAGQSTLVSEQGGRAASYREENGAAIMQHAEITARIHLGRGAATAHVYTCDFSYDYVKINADYRS